MDQLKQIWEYRFWIAVVLAVLVPLIGYGNISGLSDQVAQRESQLNNLVTQLNGLSSATNPNPSWVRQVDALRGELSKQVEEAWRVLYERQKPFFVWPKTDEYDFAVEIGSLDPKDQNVQVPIVVLNAYRDVYPEQMREIWRLAEPRQDPDTKQLVDFPFDLVRDSPLYWNFGAETPTLQEIWLAQEDAWFLKSLVVAIAAANKNADSWRDAPLKQVVQFALGPGAVDDSFAKSGKSLLPRDLQLPGESSGTTTSTSQNEGGFYAEKTEQFVSVPAYLKIRIDQRKMWWVLAALSNAPMPLEIKQVKFQALRWRSPEEEQARKSEVVIRGRREDAFYHMVELDVWGVLYRYLPPPGSDQPSSTSAAAGQ